LPERTNESNERGKRLKSSSVIVADWMTLFAEMFHEAITEGMLLLYSETLKDLEPDILNKAFLRAAKTCKFRPTPAEVIEAANIEMELAGPPHTRFQQISQAERDAALKETEELREKLRATLRAKEMPKPEPIDEKVFGGREIFTAEEWRATEAGYKRYLTEEANKDAYNRAHGIRPIPRSREEELAIYYNMPKHEREKIRKQVRP
jgi:hypothetical protein